LLAHGKQLAFFKGRAVSQVDELLIDGERYAESDIKKIIKENGLKPATKKKKGGKKK